jgi:hypothetical protein
MVPVAERSAVSAGKSPAATLEARSTVAMVVKQSLHRIVSEKFNPVLYPEDVSPARRSPKASAASRTYGSSIDSTLPAHRLRLSPSISNAVGELRC